MSKAPQVAFLSSDLPVLWMCTTVFGWFKPSFINSGVWSQLIAFAEPYLSLYSVSCTSLTKHSSNTKAVFNHFDRDLYIYIYVIICIYIYTCVCIWWTWWTTYNRNQAIITHEEKSLAIAIAAHRLCCSQQTCGKGTTGSRHQTDKLLHNGTWTTEPLVNVNRTMERSTIYYGKSPCIITIPSYLFIIYSLLHHEYNYYYTIRWLANLK